MLTLWSLHLLCPSQLLKTSSILGHVRQITSLYLCLCSSRVENHVTHSTFLKNKLPVSRSCIFWTRWWIFFYYGILTSGCHCYSTMSIWFSCIFIQVLDNMISFQLPGLPFRFRHSWNADLPLPSLVVFFFPLLQAEYVLFASNSSKSQWHSWLYMDFIGLNIWSHFVYCPYFNCYGHSEVIFILWFSSLLFLFMNCLASPPSFFFFLPTSYLVISKGSIL